MESCSTVQVIKWGLVPSSGLCWSTMCPRRLCCLWKQLTIDWITKLFDCGDTIERAFTKVANQDNLSLVPLLCPAFQKAENQPPHRSAPSSPSNVQGVQVQLCSWTFFSHLSACLCLSSLSSLEVCYPNDWHLGVLAPKVWVHPRFGLIMKHC